MVELKLLVSCCLLRVPLSKTSSCPLMNASLYLVMYVMALMASHFFVSVSHIPCLFVLKYFSSFASPPLSFNMYVGMQKSRCAYGSFPVVEDREAEISMVQSVAIQKVVSFPPFFECLFLFFSGIV